MRTRAVVVVGAVAAAVALPLALATRSPEVARRIPAAKRAEFERAAAPPGLRVEKSGVLRTGREPSWRRGIVASGFAPFPESAYRIVNQWQDVIGGRHVNVYAGRLGSDARRGVVLVQHTAIRAASPGPATASIAPGESGTLRITRARGTVLELRSSRGGSYAFDVGRGRFVSTERG
jgi:hypothetical protein